MTQYFADCKTLDELRIAYRKLAAIHHPDIGGDVATMQAINAEHDRVFEALKAAHNASADEYHQTTETPEEFRRVVVELLKLSGLSMRFLALDRRQHPRTQGSLEGPRLQVEQEQDALELAPRGSRPEVAAR